MTREHAKKMLPIITAFANGEQVQFYNGHCWNGGNEFNFEARTESYRIAPKSEDAEWLRKEACKFEQGLYFNLSKRMFDIADKLERLEGGAG